MNTKTIYLGVISRCNNTSLNVNEWSCKNFVSDGRHVHVPRLAVESRLTLHWMWTNKVVNFVSYGRHVHCAELGRCWFQTDASRSVAWGRTVFARIRRVHSAGMCTKHCIVNLNKLTTYNKSKYLIVLTATNQISPSNKSINDNEEKGNIKINK